jgi:hypothetical protein
MHVRTSTGSILAASTLAPLGREAEHLASVPFHLLAHPATIEADGSLGLFADVAAGETLWLMEGSADALASRAGAVVSSRNQIIARMRSRTFILSLSAARIASVIKASARAV